MSNLTNATQPVGFIRFHGITLLVVDGGGTEYVAAKPISDLLGLNWRTTRVTIQAGDNAVLYGARRLHRPVFDAALGSDSTPQPLAEGVADGAGSTENLPSDAEREQGGPTDLYLRLDRTHMFLARVNTDRMRSQGNVAAADWLLALQIEWAQALHAYETSGIAIKQSHRESRAELIALFKTRILAETAAEKLAITTLIAKAFKALGEPMPEDPQGSLAL